MEFSWKYKLSVIAVKVRVFGESWIPLIQEKQSVFTEIDQK